MLKTTSASASDATLRPPAGASDRKSSDLHAGDVVPGSPWNVTKSSGQIPLRPIAKPDSISEPQRPGGESTWAKVINRRYHLTIASLAYVATTCVLVIGAVNGQNNLLFWIFGIAVSGLTISGLISGSSLMGIRVRREIIDVPRTGDTFHIRYTLYNANYVVGAFALVIEELPESRGWLAGFGKKFVASWPARVMQPRMGVAYLGPRQSMVVECRCEAVARGRASFGPLRVSSTFPFGIARKSVTFAQTSIVTILPQRAELSRDVTSLASQRTQEAASMIRSRSGDETFALREHSPGDALRSVAWRASARMARPIVRDLSKRTGGRVWVVLDDTVTEEHRESFERAIMLTSSMFDLSHTRVNRLGFATLARGVLSDSERDVFPNVDGVLAVAEPSTHVANFASSHIQPRDAVLLVSSNPQSRSLLAVPTGNVTVLDPQSPTTYASGKLPDVQLSVVQRHRSVAERVSSVLRESIAASFGGQASAKAPTGGAA